MPTKIPYQPLPPLLFAAIVGILTDRFLAPYALLWALLCFVALIAWFNLRRYPLILFACAAFFGFWHHDHWYRFAENDVGCYAPGLVGGLTPPALAQPAAIIGTVAEMPRYYPKPPSDPGKIFESSERTVFTLRAEKLRDGSDWIPISGNVLVSIYDDCRSYRIGDRLQLFGELIAPMKPSNPGDFDYDDYLRGHRTRSLLRCSDKTAASLLESSRFSFGRTIESIRRAGLKNLETHLSPQTIPIAEAMIFGVRESVDDEIRQNMIDTGTMHLLAISGLHVTLIAGIAAWFLRRLQYARRTTALAMIVFVLFYLLLTDVRPPAIRAVALTCSVAIALYVNRPTAAVNVLCASALVVLLVSPSELFQFGAQLSFIATGSFLWMPFIWASFTFHQAKPTATELQTLRDIEQIELTSWRWLRRVRRMLRRTGELFLASLIIWLFTMPLLLSNVHVFTPLAILVNPLMWFPLTPAMACGFITAMVGQVPLLGSIFGFITDWSFWLLIEMIAWFHGLGGHYWVPGLPWWWNLGFYTVFAIFTFLPIRRPHWTILLTVLVVWILIGIGAGYYRDFERQRADRLTLSVFSVGHGNCVLITTPENRTIVCDAGSLMSPRYATDVLSRSLWRLGKTHIEAILISHPDNDHFNGVTLLADRFSIGTVLISPYCSEISTEPDRKSWSQLMAKLEAKQIPIRIIGEGDDLSAQGLPQSTILHPPKMGFEDRGNMNATSLVVRIEHRGVGIILPGDLDCRETPIFLQREPMPAQIVMVPHHGGRSMQTERLIDWTTPQTLIFSTGKLTYNPEMLEQYREQGYEVRSTFTDGAIVIDIE
jgi:competence protein ComEC